MPQMDVPRDVMNAAAERANAEHRSLPAVTAELLRSYADGDPAPDAVKLGTVRAQAHRYLVARFGKDYVFRAPETFENALERWIWAVSGDSAELAEECMAAIETHFAAVRAEQES